MCVKRNCCHDELGHVFNFDDTPQQKYIILMGLGSWYMGKGLANSGWTKMCSITCQQYTGNGTHGIFMDKNRDHVQFKLIRIESIYNFYRYKIWQFAEETNTPHQISHRLVISVLINR